MEVALSPHESDCARHSMRLDVGTPLVLELFKLTKHRHVNQWSEL